MVDKNATFFDESSKELQQLVTRRKKITDLKRNYEIRLICYSVLLGTPFHWKLQFHFALWYLCQYLKVLFSYKRGGGCGYLFINMRHRIIRQIIDSWGTNTLLGLRSLDSWGTNTSLCLRSFDSRETNTSLCLCSFHRWGTNNSLCLRSFDSWGTNTALRLRSFDSWGTNTLVCLRSFNSLGTNKFVFLHPFDSWGTNIFVKIKKKKSPSSSFFMLWSPRKQFRYPSSLSSYL